MTKFNFDLSSADKSTIFSTKHPLTNDEIFYLSGLFAEIAEASDKIPEDVFNAMGDIQTQMETDGRLSQKQIEYIEQVVSKYCCALL
jgi:cob(I)alamin adenosyltransferase